MILTEAEVQKLADDTGMNPDNITRTELSDLFHSATVLARIMAQIRLMIPGISIE